jgi:hypothetical protein
MVPAATLKVYEPLDAFDLDERGYWERYAAARATPPRGTLLLDREHGLHSTTATLVTDHEHAEIVERGGVVLVCPHRTKLRMLASVLAFRRSIPAEVVRAFMPEDEVERAAEEIESLRSEHPTWRNHMLDSSWEVPLHWFVAFDDSERQLIEHEDHSRSLRYETVVRAARERIEHALAVVRGTLPNPAVIAPVAGLEGWLEDFDASAVLMLDYGDVGRFLPDDRLRRDHTARDIWGAIAALAEGDGDRATAHYMVAAERWSGIRRRESWN